VLTPAAPARVLHPPNLHAVEVAPGEWGVDHIDTAGNRWALCECAHATAADALTCARETLDAHGRDAFDTYNFAVGGLTWDAKPIPAWDAVTDTVRDGWRMAGLSARKGQTIR
jgi:hypothetical protein